MTGSPFHKKSLGTESIEPAVTPPPSGSNSGFIKKPKIASSKSRKKEIPEGLWLKCSKCSTMLYDKELDDNLKVCHHCQHHFPFSARERIESIVEPGSFQELDAALSSMDPLQFPSYPQKIADYQKETGARDAVITGTCHIGGHESALGVMDFSFLGGSMGSVVGEKLTRLIERATRGLLE